MYIVWYWQSGELQRDSCGRDANYAWRLVMAYYDDSYSPNYMPWLEYVGK